MDWSIDESINLFELIDVIAEEEQTGKAHDDGIDRSSSSSPAGFFLVSIGDGSRM